MGKVIEADYDQLHLLPPALEDWIGREHPARFVREVVEQMDLKGLGFREQKGEEGRPPYANQLLLRVWLYGYLKKVRSSRGLEQACREQIGFIWLCGNRAPDHNTLWRFYRDNKKSLRGVFKQTVQIAINLELAGLVLQAVDGTKLQAVCSGRKGFSKAELERLLEQLEQSIEAAQEQPEPGDQANELPGALSGPERLRQKVAEALRTLQEQKRRHVHPHEPQARRMHCEQSNRFGYNAQAVVDEHKQIIVAAEVTEKENDLQQLSAMAQEAARNTGKTVMTVADGGYASSVEFARAEAARLPVLTPLPNGTANKKNNPYHSSNFRYEPDKDRVICPQGRAITFARVRLRRGQTIRLYRSAAACRGCAVRTLCTRDRHGRSIEIGPAYAALQRHRMKLRDSYNQQLLKQRSRIVEPVFAQIKHNGGFRRWTVQGTDNVRTQWALLCSAWNLSRIYNAWKANGGSLGPQNPLLRPILAFLAPFLAPFGFTNCSFPHNSNNRFLELSDHGLN